MISYTINDNLFHQKNDEGIFILSPKGETIILKDEVACTIFDLFNLNETMTLSKIYEILRGKFSIPVEDGEFENDIVSFIQTLIGYQVIKGL